MRFNMATVTLLQPLTSYSFVQYLSPFILSSLVLTAFVVAIMGIRRPKPLVVLGILVTVNSLLVAAAAALGASWVYSEHFALRALDGSTLLRLSVPGLLAILLGVILGAFEAIAARPLLNVTKPSRTKVFSWFAIAILACLTGILMAVTFMLYGLWATG
jgi:hypothetical protein